MIPRDKLVRLQIPVPELSGYLVDSEGQLWRESGTRHGRARPLKPMSFVDAIRGWDQRGGWSHDNGPVLHVMPGVWRWCSAGHADGLKWNTHGQGDSTGFFMRYAFGGAIGRPKPWADWTDAERQAQAQCDKFADRNNWYVLRIPALLSDSFLVAGPITFASIQSRGTLTADGTSGTVPPR